MMDSENKDALLKLMRYHNKYGGEGMITLDDYVKSMKAGQNKIYFVVSTTKESALTNPFMEIFKNVEQENGADAVPPVLILTNNADEFCFQ